MAQEIDLEKTYYAGYDAFERGDYREANHLAQACLENSTPSEYWYAGALGLQCWIANFTSDIAALEKSASQLLDADTGEDKPWFDGLAALNLGLAYQRAGQTKHAKALFGKAAHHYSQQKLHPGQLPEWQHVLDFFSTLAAWLEKGELTLWQVYTERLANECQADNSLCQHLLAAADLMLRYAKGETLKQEAQDLLKTGVSRTFLSILLLDV